jgi:hypothetical protein
MRCQYRNATALRYCPHDTQLRFYPTLTALQSLGGELGWEGMESDLDCGIQGLDSDFRSGMNKPADTIREEHVNFFRFDDRGNFSLTPHGMDHYLTRTIRSGHVIRFALN